MLKDLNQKRNAFIGKDMKKYGLITFLINSLRFQNFSIEGIEFDFDKEQLAKSKYTKTEK